MASSKEFSKEEYEEIVQSIILAGNYYRLMLGHPDKEDRERALVKLRELKKLYEKLQVINYPLLKLFML